VALGQVAARVIPTAPLAPVKDLTDLAFSDPQRRVTVRRDPMRYTGRMRLRTAVVVHALGEAATECAARLAPDIALAVFLGTNDRLVSVPRIRAAVRGAGAADKVVFEYVGAQHVLVYEQVDTVAAVARDLTGWLLAHADPARRPAPAADVRVERRDDVGRGGFPSDFDATGRRRETAPAMRT
jgi:alpha-beta hydrolase superfamily lysophospholipase